MHGIAMLPMRPSQEDSALALERSKGSKRYSMRRARVWKNSGILNQQRHHRWLRSDESGCWEVHQTVHHPQRQGKEEGYHCDFPMPGLRMVPDVQWKDSCRCLSWQTFQGKLPHSSGRSESKRGRLTFSLFRNAHSAIPELAFSFSGIYMCIYILLWILFILFFFSWNEMKNCKIFFLNKSAMKSYQHGTV